MSGSNPSHFGTQPASFSRLLVTAAAVVVALFGLRAAGDMAMSILFAALVTICALPYRNWLVGRGMRSSIAFLVTLATYILIIVVAALITVYGMVQLANDWPTYADRVDEIVAETTAFLESIGLGSVVAWLADSHVVTLLASILATMLVQAVIGFGVSVIFVAYMLVDAPGLPAKARAAFGPDSGLGQRARRTTDRLFSYVVARSILGAAAAAIETALLLVLGVPYALTWGVLSFVMSFVPNVGFIIALIPPAILALITSGWVTALIVVIGYSVVNVAVDYVVQPRYIGKSVGLSPGTVFFSLVIWTALFGALGALLSVPLTIALTEIAGAFDDSRWIAVLAGEAPKADDALGPAEPTLAHAATVPDSMPIEEAPGAV